MRWIFSCVALAAVTAASFAQAGVNWEPADVAGGLARAAREGRPVLLAVNALEGEGANEMLCRQAYPSAKWEKATQGYVNFVCNANTHGSGEPGATCSRYGGIPCASHQSAWRYAVRRFAPVSLSLISPQHVILEPDGGLAWRKEYYTGVVTPELLDRYFVRISPELAYERAGEVRAARIERLEAAKTTTDAVELARQWLRSDDVFAAAGVLRAIDFSFDEERRLRLIETLEKAKPTQVALLGLLADEKGGRPDDRPEEAMAMAVALLSVDRDAGVRLLARIACHTADAGLRQRAFDRWLAAADGPRRRPEELSPREQALHREAQLLTGAQAEPAGIAPDGLPAPLDRRLRRAESRAGLPTRCYPRLEDALESGTNGELRGALLEASPDEVRTTAKAVGALLRARPPVPRLRHAAALALLGAGLGLDGRVSLEVWGAINDPLGGEELRAEAVRRLGADPGWSAEDWIEAVDKAVRGGE